MLVIVDHRACEQRADELRDALYKLMDKLHDVTLDRDEWKEQHENLLAIYRSQTDELAKVRAALQSTERT